MWGLWVGFAKNGSRNFIAGSSFYWLGSMQSPLEAVRNERQWHQWVLNHWALAAKFGQFISLSFFWLDARDRLCPRAVHGNRENRECNSMEQPETFMQQRVSGNECHQGLSYVFPQFHECHVIAMWLLYRLPVYKECHGTMAQEEVNLLLCGCVWQTRLVALCWLRQRIRRHLSESCNMPISVVASDSPYRSYRNPLTISTAGRLRSTEAVIWRVRRTGIVSANSTDLPCLNFEPDDLDISIHRCSLYYIHYILLWSSYSSWNAAVSCCFQVFDGSRMRPSQRARAVPCLKTQQKDAMAFVPTLSTRVRRGKLPGDPDHYN